MRCINERIAGHGWVIYAHQQTDGKGQRGNKWSAEPGKNLLSSVVLVPNVPIEHQFLFNAAITTEIVKYLKQAAQIDNIAIKWTNDIIINDKKAGGILIENVLQGAIWQYAVVGVGINVLQTTFPDNLPHATSLCLHSNATFDIGNLAEELGNALVRRLKEGIDETAIEGYNSLLYKKGEWQRFMAKDIPVEYSINEALPNGLLSVTDNNGNNLFLTHGSVQWVYGT